MLRETEEEGPATTAEGQGAARTSGPLPESKGEERVVRRMVWSVGSNPTESSPTYAKD